MNFDIKSIQEYYNADFVLLHVCVMNRMVIGKMNINIIMENNNKLTTLELSNNLMSKEFSNIIDENLITE